MTPSPQDTHAFAYAIEKHLGLEIAGQRFRSLDVLLTRRCRELRCDCTTYLRNCLPTTSELALLGEYFSVGETYFFRNSGHFRALAEDVLPQRIAARSNIRRLRILSAGCATGDELYTIAIILATRFPELLKTWQLILRGVDLNAQAIEDAQAGLYRTWNLRCVTPEIRHRWFRPTARGFVLADELRQHVDFVQGHLMDTRAAFWGSGDWDIVFCRNTLMYFQSRARAGVLAHIERQLAPGGVLFLGSVENIRGVSPGLHLRQAKGAFFYERAGPDARPSTDIHRLLPVVSVPSSVVSEGFGSPPRKHVQPFSRKSLSDVRAAEARPKHSQPFPRQTRNDTQPLPVEVPLEHPANDTVMADAREAIARGEMDAATELLGIRGTDAGTLRLFEIYLKIHQNALDCAERDVQALLEAEELNPDAHYVAALLYEAKGDMVGAMRANKSAIFLDRQFAMPHIHASWISRRMGKLRTATSLLQVAVELLPDERIERIALFSGDLKRDDLIEMCVAELVRLRGRERMQAP